MPWTGLLTGVLPTRDMQRTAHIADLGHAVLQHGSDGSISPDVGALKGVGNVVPPRLVQHPMTHSDPRLSSPVQLRARAAHPHDQRHQRDQCDDKNDPPEHRNHPSREELVNLLPILLRVCARWRILSI